VSRRLSYNGYGDEDEPMLGNSLRACVKCWDYPCECGYEYIKGCIVYTPLYLLHKVLWYKLLLRLGRDPFESKDTAHSQHILSPTANIVPQDQVFYDFVRTSEGFYRRLWVDYTLSKVVKLDSTPTRYLDLRQSSDQGRAIWDAPMHLPGLR